jgi:hypothetical protein
VEKSQTTGRRGKCKGIWQGKTGIGFSALMICLIFLKGLSFQIAYNRAKFKIA